MNLSPIRALLLLLLLLAVGSFATGCNTIEGAGEDMQEAGDAIEDTAEDAAD